MVLMVWSYVVSVNAAQEIIELKNSTYKSALKPRVEAFGASALILFIHRRCL